MIEFENAGFSYGATPVLRDINLAIAPGSFQFLVGPSGAGKTTFLRLCYADLRPTEGRVRFFGRAMRPGDRDAVADLRRKLGVVPQDCRFLDHLPLAENIALPLQIGGIDMRDRADDLTALLEWVDLAGRAGALPRELSGSERRRAALARAVIMSPEVILADEPTARVDLDAGLRLMTLLIELNRMGKAVVVATHDEALVQAARAEFSPGVLRLGDGRLFVQEAAS